jgi:hypothetical protein
MILQAPTAGHARNDIGGVGIGGVGIGGVGADGHGDGRRELADAPLRNDKRRGMVRLLQG